MSGGAHAAPPALEGDDVRTSVKANRDCTFFQREGGVIPPHSQNCTIVALPSDLPVVPRSARMSYLGAALHESQALKKPAVAAFLSTIQDPRSFQHSSRPDQWLEDVWVTDRVSKGTLISVDGKYRLLIPACHLRKGANPRTVQRCAQHAIEEGMQSYERLRSSREVCSQEKSSSKKLSATCKKLLGTLEQFEELRESFSVITGVKSSGCPKLKPIAEPMNISMRPCATVVRQYGKVLAYQHQQEGRCKGSINGMPEDAYAKALQDSDLSEEEIALLQEMKELGIDYDSPLNPFTAWEKTGEEFTRSHCVEMKKQELAWYNQHQAPTSEKPFEDRDPYHHLCLEIGKRVGLSSARSVLSAYRQLPEQDRARFDSNTCAVSGLSELMAENPMNNHALQNMAAICRSQRMHESIRNEKKSGCFGLSAKTLEPVMCHQGEPMIQSMSFEGGEVSYPESLPIDEMLERDDAGRAQSSPVLK